MFKGFDKSNPYKKEKMETLIFLLLFGWSDEICIAQDTIEISYPIAVPYKSDSILCIWREEFSWDGIRIKGSFFDCSTWLLPKQLSPDFLSDLAGWNGRPGLTVDSSNNIWIAWYYGEHPCKQKTIEPTWGIYTRTYDGTEWGAPAFAETSMTSELTMCTAKDGRVLIGWEEDTHIDTWGYNSLRIGWYEDTCWSRLWGIQAYGVTGSGCGETYSYGLGDLTTDTSNSVFISYIEHYSYWTPDTIITAGTVIIKEFKEDTVIEIDRITGLWQYNWNPVIDVDSENRLWLVWVVIDEDGITNLNSYCYQGYVLKAITTDSFADLEPSIVCHNNGVPWVTWTSKRDYSIWTAYYIGENWHSERVSKEDSSYNSNPYIIEGPQGKLWVFWQKSKGDTNSICCSWREQVGIKENVTPKPQSIKLEVSPNPFTQRTIISYSLNKHCKDYTMNNSRLTIYDISGRLIQTFYLTNDQSQVTWNTNKLPGGIYFLHLNIGNIKKVKKLILIK